MKRRDFIKSAGAGGAVATIATGCSTIDRDGVVSLTPRGPENTPITLNINGRRRKLNVEPRVTLLDALRTLLVIGCSSGRDYKRYVRRSDAPYAWLRADEEGGGFGADAVIHLGTHGTLEWLDGKAIAMSIGELYGGTYWAHKTAYDEDYRKYAPGILKQFYLLRELAGKGVSRIDFQGRLDDFKRTWTDQGVEATKVRIYPFNPRGALALACDAGRQAGSMWTARRPT